MKYFPKERTFLKQNPKSTSTLMKFPNSSKRVRNNKILLTTNRHFLCDRVVSAIGYDSKDLSKFTCFKPCSIMGWCGPNKSQLSQLFIEAQKIADSILPNKK